MTAFDDLIAAGPAALDGGLASELEARGHDLTGILWSARLLRDDPDAIRDVHRTYYESGATVGISASYQASRSGFARQGLDASDADRLLALSVKLLRGAVDLAGKHGARIVEGYPVIPSKDKVPDVFAWTGMLATFEKAGFREVHRWLPNRPIMRIDCR